MAHITTRHADPPDLELDPAETPDDARSSGPSRTSTVLALLLVGAIGGGALFVSGFALGRLSGATPGTTDDRQDLFRPFWDAYNDVSTNYVGEIDQHLLVEGAINGIFDALGDPYSSYMTEEEYQASLSGISGEFEGVGIELATVDANGQGCETISQTCRLVITRVIRGSPALDADLRENDIVLAVNGATTSGQTAATVVPNVRGQRGTSVVLTVQRGDQQLDVSVTRDVIQREDVRSEVLAEGRVGYVKILGFSSASAADLREHVRRLVEDEDVSGLILDLRDDPGGYVDAARKIASEFVGTGPLYWEQGANQEPVAQQPDPGGVATDPSLPMVVLVNGGTASASEIVAGSLQGNGRAQLVGEKTFGKGTIQEFKQLEGSGGYRLSVRKWLTPDQTWIHGVGLVPDVEVAGAADPQTGADPQLERAIRVLLEAEQAPALASPMPSAA